MCSSAMRSRSAVVIPARTCSRSRARVSPTTRPARRMRRIWSGVLTSSRLRPNTGSGAQRGLEAGGDGVHVAHPVHLAQQPTLAVDRGQGRGLLDVDLLAVADDLFGVVGAPLELGPLQQASHDL